MSQCSHFWQHPRINQGYFAPTYPQIRDIYYPTIEEVSCEMGLRVEIREANKEVHFYSGRQYRGTTICRSMERPETIIGFKIGHALVDELDVMKQDKAEQAWRKIIARMRYNEAGLRNGIDVTTTPEGFKFTHKMFCLAVEEKPALCKTYGMIQASTYDNAKNLPADYISSLIDIYPEQLISAYLNGQFVNLTSGTVYYTYDRKKHNSMETIRPKEPLYVGMDFNVGKMAATIYVQRGKAWHAVAELHSVFDTPEMVRVLKERYPEHHLHVYPDSSGDSRKSVNASVSDIAVLRQAGFSIRVRSTNPFVKDRVLAMNTAFEKGYLFINAQTCPVTARCLEQQAYDDNGEPDKKSGHDHQNDATGYPVAYEMPVRKPMSNIVISQAF